jgi:hypothetical protein
MGLTTVSPTPPSALERRAFLAVTLVRLPDRHRDLVSMLLTQPNPRG